MCEKSRFYSISLNNNNNKLLSYVESIRDDRVYRLLGFWTRIDIYVYKRCTGKK